MKQFTAYLAAHLKRTLRCYLAAFAVLLAALAALAGAGAAMLAGGNESDAVKKVRVGIVATEGDQVLDMALAMLSTADSSRFVVEMHPCGSEEEALQALSALQLDAYAVIPPDFVQSVLTLQNASKIRYVMAAGSAGLASTLTQEIIGVISHYIVETQAGVIAMCDLAAAGGMPGGEVWDKNIEMSLAYADLILGRAGQVQVTEIGVGSSLSMPGYYVCGLTVFFVLLWGVCGCEVRSGADSSLQRLLYTRGYGAAVQVLAEYLPFLLCTLLTLLLPYAIAAAASVYIGFGVPELTWWLPADYLLAPLRALPAVFLLSALQFLVYEAASSLIGSVLLQLILAAFMGYVGGCFYPIYFFPQAVQRLAAWLPTGIAFRWYAGVLSGSADPGALALCLAGGGLLLALAVLVRKGRITGRART